MHFPTLPALALSALATAVVAQHGASELGNMGPVAFLWPEDRAWDADHDNTAPCGSVAAVGNRTRFPISEFSLFHPHSSMQYTKLTSNSWRSRRLDHR
jgi:hypothetical protein